MRGSSGSRNTPDPTPDPYTAPLTPTGFPPNSRENGRLRTDGDDASDSGPGRDSDRAGAKDEANRVSGLATITFQLSSYAAGQRRLHSANPRIANCSAKTRAHAHTPHTRERPT